MRKFLCFFGMVAAMMLAFSINAFAEVQFTTARRLPDAQINVPYSGVTLGADDGSGSGTYTYTLLSSLPDGLSLSSDGVISGTPTVGGYTYQGINIRATNEDTGESATMRFSIKVYAVSVNFTVTNTRYNYDGQPHKAVISSSVEGVAYTVSYGGETFQTNAGSYPIKITVTSPGYKTGTLSSRTLNIAKNNDVNINFTNLEYPYTGLPISVAPDVSAVFNEQVISLPYSITYYGLDNISYGPTTNPPTLPGRYRVICNVTDTNYATPTDNVAVFTILPTRANFTLQSPNVFTYGDSWSGVFSSSPEVPQSEYNVVYIKNGTEYAAPADAGAYNINIRLNEGSYYAVGSVTPSVVTVNPRQADFNISPATLTETGSALSVSVTTAEPLTEGTDYTVSFFKDGSAVSDITDAGVYDVQIDVKNPNYTLGTVQPSKIVVKEEGAVEKTPVYFSENGSAVYSGSNQEIDLINTAGLVKGTDYTVSYSQGGVSIAPQNAGTYDVDITLTGSAADLYEIADQPDNFVIAQKPVYFTLSQTSFKYNNTVQIPDITNDCGISAYSVTYSSGGFTISQPKNIATYRVNITVTDSNYIYSGQNSITFEITSNPHNINLTYNANMGAVSFVRGGAVTQTGDDVQLDFTPKDDYIIENVTVDGAVLDENNAFVMPDRDVNITVAFRRIASIKLDFGNSIFGRIEKNNAITDKDAAKAAFLDDRSYEGKYYSAAAWKDTDIDADDTALILYNRINTTLPQATGYNSDDEEADMTVTLTAGDTVIDLTGESSVKLTDISPGVYNMEYSFFDTYMNKNITAERKVVVLWNLGDVNMDRNTNGVDANWILASYNALSEETDDEKLFKFRMCDVNKDGVVDEKDSDAILNRIVKRIEQYYR